MQQPTADGLAGACLEQHVVGDHHGCVPTDLEKAHHMLHEVELFVAGRRPEVLPLVAV
ncbi:MAG: hypothetical protein OXH61_04240 [Acidimicrobiaceae bacterium]|nr:hypothetical protein [Acidimicrobiaceae bacterium]